MLSAAFLAQIFGRINSVWRTLSLSCLIMLAINPLYLNDLGFILSFVATSSLVLFQKRVEKRIMFVPKIIRESLSTTLAAQIGVTPILFASFGQFNLLSPLINVLVLWTVPFIMVIGLVGGVVGLIIPFLGRLILYLSYPLTWWFIKIVSLF